MFLAYLMYFYSNCNHQRKVKTHLVKQNILQLDLIGVCWVWFLQYDFIGWMPNTPVTLKCPPPSVKGEATEETLLDTLPSIDVTVHGMATVWLLSKESTDAVSSPGSVNISPTDT